MKDPSPETDEGSTYKESARNPDLDNIIDAEEQRIRDIQNWLENTPEGRELSERADSDPNILQYYPRWIEEGETHEQALQSWSGALRRIWRDVKDIPREIENIVFNSYGELKQHYNRRLEDAGVTDHAGAVGLVGFDIVWGTFNFLAQRN